MSQTEDRPIKQIVEAFDRFVQNKMKDPQVRRDMEKLIIYARIGADVRGDWK